MAQHSRKGAKLQSLTANRLLDGIVVYMTDAGSWSESLQDAAVAEGPDAARELLSRADHDVENNALVDPYLFEVERDGCAIRAVSVRETIRQAGPTVRPDLGKQAELA